MCGIVGVITKETHGVSVAQLDWFQDALVADAVRGLDATGVVSVNPYKAFDLLKVASHPYHLLQNPEWSKWRAKAWDGHLILGHNRKATVGDKTNPENAHPFISKDDRIILVHNGFIDNWTKFDPKNEIRVDSAVLPGLLSDHNGDFAKVAPQISGAFALVWYDTKDHTVNFVRNKERPLALMETSQAVFFASEPGMLLWLAQRNNLKVTEVSMFTPDAWSKYYIKSRKWAKNVVLKWKEVKGQQWQSASNWSNHAINDWRGWEGEFPGGDAVEDAEYAIVGPSVKAGEDQTPKKPVAAALEKPGFVTNPTPWYEREAEALQKLKNNLQSLKVILGEPVRLESIPRAGGFNVFFKLALPDTEEFRNLPHGLDKWTLRMRMAFPSLESAQIWRNKPHVLLTPSKDESLLSHGDKVLCLIGKGVQEVEDNLFLKTANGALFSPTEWTAFVKKHNKCTRCNNTVPVRDVRYVAVNHKDHAQPTLVCGECMKKNFEKHAPEVQKSIIATTGVDPRQWSPE